MGALTYNIELGDGKLLEDLTLNGNNYVSKDPITEDDFTDLSHVIITDSEGCVTEMDNVKLLQIAEYADGWYFILEEMSLTELKAMANDAQILFTALATDTLLEEE